VGIFCVHLSIGGERKSVQKVSTSHTLSSRVVAQNAISEGALYVYFLFYFICGSGWNIENRFIWRVVLIIGRPAAVDLRLCVFINEWTTSGRTINHPARRSKGRGALFRWKERCVCRPLAG